MGRSTRCRLHIGKQVFHVLEVDEHGAVQARRTLAPRKALEYFSQRPVCLMGIEACNGAHHWSREFCTLGHTIELRASQFVMPYCKRGRTIPTTPRRLARRSANRTGTSWP